MKKIFWLLSFLFVFAGSSNAQNIAKPQTICKIYAYVIDKDPNGLNVHRGAGTGFGILGKIMPDENGIMVNVIGSTGNWLLIENVETVDGEKAFGGKGWVFASMLGTSTRLKSNLYASANRKSKVLAALPTEDEVTILSCSGEWARVKSGNRQGWLAPENQCGNPVTTCP